KLIISEGKKWCADVLDEFIRIDQCLQIGESIVRRYTPTSTDQDTILINIYSTESEQARCRTSHLQDSTSFDFIEEVSLLLFYINDNLVEEVYITKHDCDNRGYESDTSLSNSISSSISSNEIERTLASLESCQVEIHRSENNGQVSTTSTYSKNQIKSSTSSLESATNQIKNSLDAIKLKITQAECNNNDIEVDTKVTSAEDSGRYKQLDPVSGYQNTTIIPIEDLEDAPYKVIIAIDFGTTYTGYAFSFVNNDCDIHIMRKWEDRYAFSFVNNDCDIHIMRKWEGSIIRVEESHWNFAWRSAALSDSDVNRDLKLSAANGESILALTVFKHSLVYLKYQALRELNDQAEEPVSRDEIRWVITVPAIWSQQAKQFIREAAYSADLCNIHAYDQLLIALEPEAAAIFCRSLRLSQMFTRANESSILVDEPIFKDRDEVFQHIKEVLNKPRLSSSITHLFLVGGFAESQLLQDEVKRHFSKTLKVIIPQDVSLSVLKGAVMFGLDPHIVSLRKATHTYGIGVFQPFQPGLHSEDKLIISEGKKWCADVLDEFIRIDQCLQIGESIVRRYTPTSTDQDTILINIYSTESEQARVRNVAALIKYLTKRKKVLLSVAMRYNCYIRLA
ncbi:heat shock 70 kDa protein 12A-like, partial [Diaphorina citri]|uniref:Heat shock 70 kDa protein 12A-like n=1 Tax=Diaphorina citri TaxID=121845 RepID=A0A3Q0J375_DIACI